MIVLGIESSCDETGAALVTDTGAVLSDVVSSQVDLHGPYGGVVPELAARAHMENVLPVVERALSEANKTFADLSGIAVTQGPGLVGALLVGVQAGKAIAMARGLPIVGVNHLIGHLLAVHLQRPAQASATTQPQTQAPTQAQTHGGPSYPYIALLVSGGHTALYEVRSAFDIEQLGQTRDDAAGEAYDKVAKVLGLGYPGGPRVDKLAATGDAKRIALPRPLAGRASLEFSFSGLKTAVAQRVAALGVARDDTDVADVCAAFQRNVVDVLVRKSCSPANNVASHVW